jgi:hypothetical protein
VADPENKLGIAQMVAREVLADGNRIRELLADEPGAADRFLSAQAGLVGADVKGVSDTDSVAQETTQPGVPSLYCRRPIRRRRHEHRSDGLAG